MSESDNESKLNPKNIVTRKYRNMEPDKKKEKQHKFGKKLEKAYQNSSDSSLAPSYMNSPADSLSPASRVEDTTFVLNHKRVYVTAR